MTPNQLHGLGYGPMETTDASRSYVVLGDEAPSARRPVQHRARGPLASEALPQPKAATAVVFSDPGSRTLTVRLSELEDGYTRLLWRQAWQRQRRSQEAGWPANGAPWVFADVPGARRVAHGVPVEGGAMSFHFPLGPPGTVR